MPPNTKSNYDGPYIPRNGTGVGHLRIDGRSSLLRMVTDRPPAGAEGYAADHHGVLTDGTRVSLLYCVPTGETDYFFTNPPQHETLIFPNYIIAGPSFIGSSDPVIKSLCYHFENIDSLLNAFRTFGTLRPGKDIYHQLMESEYNRREEISKKHGWPKPNFAPEVGEHPALLYYSGVWEIVTCDVPVGTVKLANRPSLGMGSATGVGIENQVTAILEFNEPKAIRDGLDWLARLHSFFELCLGRRQRYLWIEAVLATEEAKPADTPTPPSELHWSCCNDRVSGKTRTTNYNDVLVSLSDHKEEFSKVLSGWLSAESEVAEARLRFTSGFHSGIYSIDRIVGAANMYDLLPESHVPKRIDLDQDIADAVQESRERFRALPTSTARHSILSALGRVGVASLRDKVRHRADIVLSADTVRFAEIYLPCDEAVLCRNHFVHGSDASFDYRTQVGSFVFLIETLEFVFAVSDLIELGWDYDFWLSKGNTASHPFGAYHSNFERALEHLKTLLHS